MKLDHLSNDELLARLQGLVVRGHVALARLLAYLGEVEERRLDLAAAYSSLWAFCVHRLGMSDDEACRRIGASRLVRKFPVALAMIERGELHVSALLLLRDHLTWGNHDELLRAACGRTTSQVKQLIATRFPLPDVPSLIRPLPSTGAEATPLDPTQQPATVSSSPPGEPPGIAPKLSRIEPLSAERYKVQFTAGAALRAKLERAVNLMRHKNPSGDLAVVVDRALDLLLDALEKQRLAKTKRPAKSPGPGRRGGNIPRAVRREIFERDGEMCTFVDEQGRRCEERAFLELDHVTPRALGGTNDAANLRVRCRAHNGFAAELVFGRAHIEKKKAERRSSFTRDQDAAAAVSSPRDPEARVEPRPPTEESASESADTSVLPPVPPERGTFVVMTRSHGVPSTARHPQQDGYDAGMALRALAGLGFKQHDARRALGIIDELWESTRPPIATVIRQALVILT